MRPVRAVAPARVRARQGLPAQAEMWPRVPPAAVLPALPQRPGPSELALPGLVLLERELPVREQEPQALAQSERAPGPKQRPRHRPAPGPWPAQCSQAP